MSEKIKQIYECNYCGAQSLKWSGRCFECGSWGTLQLETRDEKEEKKRKEQDDTPSAEVVNLESIEQEELERLKCRME